MLAVLLALLLNTRICIAPCDVRASITIERSPHNRHLVVQIDGPEFHGSIIDLDGDREPVHYPDQWFKGLRPGVYGVTVILFRSTSSKEVARAFQIVRVLGPGEIE